MVALLAKLTTLFSNDIFFIRLGPVLCSTGSIVLLRYLALALYRDELVVVEEIVDRCYSALEVYLKEGIDRAMALYN